MSIHSGHRLRVKNEFLARGLEGWPDHRVLELLLFYSIPQGDVNELAHVLLDRFDTLSGVLDAPTEELKKIPGVGEHTITLFRLIPAVMQRYMQRRMEPGEVILTYQEAAVILEPYFVGARNEMVYILCTDGRGKLLGVRKISEGSIFTSDINLRRIAEECLGLRAARIYLAHNHVSNLAYPSEADWNATEVVRSAMVGVGIEMVDHLIFVDGGVVSMQESGHLRQRSRYRLL